MTFTLRVFHSGRAFAAVPLRGTAWILGSAQQCDIRLPDASVPDAALRMRSDASSWTIESLPGTKAILNGRSFVESTFRPGDRVEIGACSVVLDEESRSALPASAPTPSILESLVKFANHVGIERDLGILLDKIRVALCEIVGANEAFIFILDASGGPRLFSPAEPVAESRFSDTVIQAVLREGCDVFLPNAMADPKYSGAESVAGLKLKSVMCCRIRVAGRTRGLIYLGSSNPAVSFSEVDLSVLKVHALLAGGLIDHVEYISRQRKLLETLSTGTELHGIVADSPSMRRIIDELRAIAPSRINVLLTGETGTGKDVLANLIHQLSPRKEKPFIALNCSTIRGELLASEMFGHKKGSFTGATQDRPGLFAAADGGTLFLDEIGEMDPPLQAMLLRALETGRIRPIGGSGEEKVDVRVVCATNRDLQAMVSRGTFREDLFFRINQISISLPPLRERGEDVFLLAYHFLESFKREYPAKEIRDYHPQALDAMGMYRWPGNVRELINAVHKAVLLSSSPLVEMRFLQSDVNPETTVLNLEEATRRFQDEYMGKILTLCRGDKENAARVLEIGRSTFFRYLSRGNVSGKGEVTG